MANWGRRAWALLPLALIGLPLGVIAAIGYWKFSTPPAPSIPITSVNTPPSGPQAIVGQASVIDGDTIEIHGTPIRLFGIDAPESDQTCTLKGEPYRCGQQAANALDNKIRSHTVECRQKDQDQSNRVVAVCFVGVEDTNGWMVEQGWALAYRQYSTDYVRQERNAANSKRGIWQGEFQVPWEWRRTQPQRPQPKTESLRLPPARPYAVYYRPGDLSGTRYSTLAECNRVRQQAGNVGSCVMK